MSARPSSFEDKDWETIDPPFIFTLHSPDNKIDRNSFYASVCHVAGFSAEGLRIMVSKRITDSTHPIMTKYLAGIILNHRLCPILSEFDNPLSKQLYEYSCPYSVDYKDFSRLGDIVLSKDYLQVSSIELQMVQYLMREINYFVYFAPPSPSPSIDLQHLKATLKLSLNMYNNDPDFQVILLGFNTSKGKYMFFTMDPLYPNSGSTVSHMFGFGSPTPTIDPILAPTARQLDKAFNLNVY